MATVLLRNINPLGYVDLPLLRRNADGSGADHPDWEEPGVGGLVPGEEFECPAELAGQAPHWRPATDGDDLARLETREVDGVVDVWDLGSGLLAQIGNYELVGGDEYDGLTVQELRAHADANGIDLGDAKKKSDILEIIRKAGA